MRYHALLIAILLATMGATALASPREDLESASQQTRDAAAEKLRATFVMPPRERWDALVAAIQPGETKDSVLERLRPFNAVCEMALAGGGSSKECYRLDDGWSLCCCFERWGGVFRTELIEDLRRVWVAPPANFSGVWTTYFANGQRSDEINYAHGRYFGVLTSFRSDGSRCFVQYYDATGINGLETGYYPSGRVNYRAFHRNGKPTGTWIFYHEDGSVKSTRENPTPGMEP